MHGLIGMPASISRFKALQEYRRCFLAIRDELHERGFLTNTIFFEQPEGALTPVIDRLKKEEVDSVFWLLPDGANRATPLRLRDLGIHFIGLSFTTSILGIAARYQIRRREAIRSVMRAWRQDSQINGAAIVRLRRETPAHVERLAKLRALIESQQIECEIATVREGHIDEFLKSLCKNKSCGIVLPAPAAALLGWRAPEALTDVLESCRIALIDGLMDLPYAESIPRAEVDLVAVNWPPVARQIATDMLTGVAFDDSETTVFDAKAHLGVPLQKYEH